MQEFIEQWGSAFWQTTRETGPFLVLGLFLAGLLHVFVPARLVLRALGKKGWRGAALGALIGTPLPLCSCSVIPTAFALRRQGASVSSTVSFTIATPETSIDALMITMALLPLSFLGIRPLAALVLAIIVAVAVERFSADPSEDLKQELRRFSTLPEGAVGPGPTDERVAEICKICGLMSATEHRHGFLSCARAVLSYAFGPFFDDIATWIVLGLIVAAAIQVLVPGQSFAEGWWGEHPNLMVLIAVLVGVPLYSCATATTPLAAVLLAKGLNPGAALALLLAGPATNIGNVFAFLREFGKRITTVYYLSLILLCWAMGIGLNLLWPVLEKIPKLTEVPVLTTENPIFPHLPAWLEIGSAWLIVLLTLRHWYGHHEGDGHDHSH